MKTMTRAQFGTLPSRQHVDACVTFEHGPDRAAIRHNLRDASVAYALEQYPAFDSIVVTRKIAMCPAVYAA